MASRHCHDCGHHAAERARFCERCGAALTPSAAPLRAPSTLEAKILEQRTWIEGERKQVTVMYTDIVGSMQLTHELEGERWGFVLDRFLAIAASAVHSYEGTVNQFTGDGLLAVFGAPLAHEDHARRACLAVLELQREVAALVAEVERQDGVTFAIRCGLNSGEVVVGAIGDDVHMDFVPIGNTTALGKRIESLAPVGSAAISAATAALVEGEFVVRELGEFEVKGAAGRQRVLELIGPGAARTRLAGVAATRGLSRFVGRDTERAQLDSVLEQALAGDGRAIGIVGDAGVGKSRLVHEFVSTCAARGLAVISTGCVAHGRYIPFLPVLAMYRDSFDIGERDAPEIARERIETKMLALDPALADEAPLLFEFLGVADPERPLPPLDPATRRRRLLDLLSRAVKARSRHEPAVLVVEDLHWIDDASAAFVEAMVEAVVGTRTVLVATYRPDYEARWANSGPHSQLRLAPLDADATDDLLGVLLGHDPSLDGLAELIEARSGGNPFFLEEIVQALAERGNLSGARGEYRLAAELEAVVLPATVQAALTARIDRLPGREKALMQTMSVIGKEIPGRLLSEISDLGEHQLAETVEALAGGQWVIPHGAAGNREYVFKHPLTQEVAYGSQLSEPRARAHTAVAAAIERAYPDGLDERAALLAHHCEASGDVLTAAGWHARAATWAATTSPADGMRHWRRVRRLVRDVEATPVSEELATKARVGILGLAWRLGITPEEAAAIHAEAHADAERFLLELHYAGTLFHSGREQDGLELCRRIGPLAVAGGDPGVALTISLGVIFANWIAGSLSEGAEAIDHAIGLAGADPQAGAGLVFPCPLADAFQHRGQCVGYMGDLEQAHHDFDRAIELAREHDDPETECYSFANLALLEADVGAIEAALGNAARGLEIAERLGNALGVVAASTAGAVAHAGAGRFADALEQAQAQLAMIRHLEIGLYNEPTLLATIARSQLALGRPEEALAAAEEAVDIMDARGLATCALPAPIALGQILIATQGAAAGERIDTVLARALRIVQESHAFVFEPELRRQLAALARLRGDDQLSAASATSATAPDRREGGPPP